MASVIISGDTSGTVTLQAPAVVGGAPVLTLPTTSGTLLTTTGGVAPGTSGNVLTSDGTTWTSAVLPAVGVGQTWSLPTRTSGTTYTNSGTKPIFVVVTFSYNTTSSGSPRGTVVVGGVTIFDNTFSISTSGGSLPCPVSFIVPVGATYVATAVSNTTITRWAELS